KYTQFFQAFVLAKALVGQTLVQSLKTGEAFRIGFQKLKRSVGSSTGQGIAHVRMAVEESLLQVIAVKGLIDFIAGDCESHRQQAACQAFCQANDIRIRLCPAAGKPVPGSAEACQDFIINRQYSSILARLRKRAYETFAAHSHATNSLD